MQGPPREAAHSSRLIQRLCTEALLTPSCSPHGGRAQKPLTQKLQTTAAHRGGRTQRWSQTKATHRGHRTLSSPVLRGDGDGCDMAVPVGAGALCLAQDVAHAALARPLCHEAVLRPVGQVVQVEGKVILQRGQVMSQGHAVLQTTGP